MNSRNTILMAVVLLMAAPDLGLAADDTAQTASAITGLMETTKAAEWMRMIFGSAAGGDGATLIGEMFRNFNVAVLAVTSVMMTYNMFTAVAESTYHGEFLGKNYSTVWVPVRLPIAAAMMFPTTTGLSAIQLLMIKAAILGSATADWMFAKTADAIYVDAVPAIAGKYQPPKGIGEVVFANHVCKHIININEILANKPGPITHKISSDAAAVEAPAAAGKTVTIKLHWVSPGNPRYHVSCGEASIAIPPVDPKVASLVDMSGTFQAALEAMSTTLNTAALAYARNVYPADLTGIVEAKEKVDPVPVIIKANQDFATAVNAKLTEVENKLRAAEAAKKGGAGKAASLKDKGWTFAGAAYLDMVAFQASINSQFKVTPVVRPATFMNVSQNPQMKKLVNDVRQELSAEMSRIPQSNGQAPSRTPGGKHSADEANEASRDETLIEARAREAMSNLLWIDLEFADASKAKDPLAKVVEFGQKSITYAWGFFTTGLVVAALGMWMNLAAISSILSPLLFTMFGLLLGVGVTCGLLLPMMPYLTFLMGVIGWLILCVEAVIAGPLWAFGHMRMEGQGFTGGVGGTGYMIVLNIIMRPSLMLIGLIASMSLMKVFVMIVDETFIPAVSGLQQYAGITVGGYGGVTAKLFFLAIYGGLIYYMCTKAFHLITQVPDRVLKWIGGGDQLGEHEGVRQIGSMAAAAAGGATGGMVGSMGGKLADAGRQAAQLGRRRSRDADGNEVMTGMGDRAWHSVQGVFRKETASIQDGGAAVGAAGDGGGGGGAFDAIQRIRQTARSTDGDDTPLT